MSWNAQRNQKRTQGKLSTASVVIPRHKNTPGQLDHEVEGHHDRWMSLARKQALKSNLWPEKMGCVILKNGKASMSVVTKKGFGTLIEAGTSPEEVRIRDNSLEAPEKPIHAELCAILGMNQALLRNATVYVSGITKGPVGVATKPCLECQRVLFEMGIKCAFYHTDSGQVFTMRSFNVG